MLKFGLINSKELDSYVKNKNALIVDVRDEEDYEKSQIYNAINIPMKNLQKNLSRIPKNKLIIFYCESGGTGILAAKDLFDRGYVTRALTGGIKNYSGIYKITNY